VRPRRPAVYRRRLVAPPTPHRRSLAVARPPILVASTGAGCPTYSRSPKNPTLQLSQKSSKSASTFPRRPIWNTFGTFAVREFGTRAVARFSRAAAVEPPPPPRCRLGLPGGGPPADGPPRPHGAPTAVAAHGPHDGGGGKRHQPARRPTQRLTRPPAARHPLAGRTGASPPVGSPALRRRPTGRSGGTRPLPPRPTAPAADCCSGGAAATPPRRPQPTAPFSGDEMALRRAPTRGQPTVHKR